MTITLVTGQAAGANADDATSIARAFPGNITSGNRIVIGVARFTPGNDPPVVGDISQSAGTATVGAFTLDRVHNYLYDTGVYLAVALFSAPVTGTGSCTITVAGGPAGCYWNIGIAEFHSDNGSIAVGNVNSGQGNSAAADSGNVTSIGGAVFVGAMGLASAGAITITPDGTFSQIYEEQDGALHMTGSFIYRIVSSGTTDSASWTVTSNHWAASVVEYDEPAAGGVTYPQLERDIGRGAGRGIGLGI